MRERLAVWAPAALGAVLCLISVTGRSIGFDEAATVSIVAQNGHALGSAIAHDGGNMSGYYVLMHVLIALFGNGTFLIRLPSVISVAAAEHDPADTAAGIGRSRLHIHAGHRQRPG